MKVIAYTWNQAVVVVFPAYQSRLEKETEDAFIQRVIKKDVPKTANDVVIVEASSLPSRDKRAVWKIVGNKVVA